MIDLIVRILSIAFPAASFAMLFSLAYWIYQQKTSSPQAESSKSDFAIYAFVLSLTGISELIYRISGAIQAEIYEALAMRFFYFLIPVAVIFLITAINASTGNPPDNGSKERPKKKPWKSRGTFFLQIFAFVTAYTAFLPDAILEDIPSLWYSSMYITFGVPAIIFLVASLRKVASILERKKVAYTVWGGAMILVAIRFLNMFQEQIREISPLLTMPLNLLVVFLGGAMIYVGFTEKTAFERFVLPIPVAEHVLDFKEGEQVVLTYSSVAHKIKVFSAFIREGLEKGDAVWYAYPDEESETIRAKLKEHGIDVEKHEKSGALHLEALTEALMPNGKLDYNHAVVYAINWWTEIRRKGYKHVRDIEDVGDFSFANGQWQKFITDYWLDPRWDDPDTSEWVLPNISPKKQVGVVFIPFVMGITAINTRHMPETEVNELLKAFGHGSTVVARHIDLLENVSSFSKSIGLNHGQLLGRKILMEFDPASNYEKVVDSLAKESTANVVPLFVFTSNTSPIYAHLADQTSIKFFLTSISTSTPQSTSDNIVLLPAKNTPLILEALSKVLETYADANVCFVFDILSGLLTTIGREKTFIFLRHALDMLSSEKITSIFLLNTSAHETEVVSRLRNLFSNQLAYNKNGLEIVKKS